jgi:hypothetical protein
MDGLNEHGDKPRRYNEYCMCNFIVWDASGVQVSACQRTQPQEKLHSGRLYRV